MMMYVSNVLSGAMERLRKLWGHGETKKIESLSGSSNSSFQFILNKWNYVVTNHDVCI